MRDNTDLFKEEIDEIREFAELDMEVFTEVLDYSRGVIEKLGDSISPMSVVDVIEGTVGNLIYHPEDEVVTVEDAVERAVANLHLGEELDDMFEDDVFVLSDEADTGKVRQ